jgi:hypothetical protein
MLQVDMTVAIVHENTALAGFYLLIVERFNKMKGNCSLRKIM